nr:nucleoside triphosphate pyrophosphohydrolase [Acanthopleuribacter pedis]
MMRRLRRGCPWDREQTPESLKKYVLEESYEVLEAIENRDWRALEDELGDFILQVVFQAEIQEERGEFAIEDVLEGIVSKMVGRHPHVFGDLSLAEAKDVEANWDQFKQREKGEAAPVSVFATLTKGLPALLESYKIGKKAAKVGFDWDDPQRVLDKIEEEIGEVRQAFQADDRTHQQEELGDLLFAVSNLVRKAGFEPEETLRQANAKFVRRFKAMETMAGEQGRDFNALDLDEQEALWNAVKKKS